jgi:hypothetical protein
MEIDASAPAIVRRSATIAAPVAVVWELLSRIDEWPSWQEEVERAELSGPLAPGASFRWKAGPFGISSRVEELEPQRAIGWSGGALGVHARHVYRLAPADGGGTVVDSQESWGGLLARVLPGLARKRLIAGVERALADLRREAERRGSAPIAEPGP